MAKRLWEKAAGGSEIHATNDPQVLIVADLQAQLGPLQEVQGLSDALRLLFVKAGVPGLGIGAASDLESFDDALDKRVDTLLDLIDYAQYSTRIESLTVFDGAWFSPQAIESVSGENVGEEAARAVDGDNGTWWQSDTGPHAITFHVRDHKKQLSRIRLRISNVNEDRTKLQGVTLRGSVSIGKIDDPGNVIASGINFAHDGDAWMEFDILAPDRKPIRYIKLDGFTSLHSDTDVVRIREFEAFVITRNHDDV